MTIVACKLGRFVGFAFGGLGLVATRMLVHVGLFVLLEVNHAVTPLLLGTEWPFLGVSSPASFSCGLFLLLA